MSSLVVSPRTGRPQPVLLGLIGVVAALGLGQLLPTLGLVNPQYFPPTSSTLSALGESLARLSFWQAVGQTMTAWAIGLAIAVTAGAVLGIIIGSLPLVREATSSTIEFLRPIPSVALIPLAVLMFGTQIQSTLLLVVYAAFWQVLVQVIAGVRDADPVALDTARTFGLSPLARARYVYWPSALPFLITGVRLAATVALVLAITAGLVIGTPGIGNEIDVARQSGAVDTMYALIVVSGGLGVVINLLVRAVERKVLAWHPSVRNTEVTA